jgi:hypothetical protein
MDMKLAIYAHQPKEVAHLPLETLEQWAKNNPSSINIWMIYCKKLLQQNHPDFQSVLRKTAFFSPNRNQLHRYLYDESWYLKNDLLPPIQTKTEVHRSNSKSPELEKDLLANAVSSSISLDVDNYDASTFEPSPLADATESKIETNNITPETESFDFLNWIGAEETKLTVVKAPQLKTEVQPEKEEQTAQIIPIDKQVEDKKRLSKEELIQRFVKLEPKITPKKVAMYNPVNVAKQSTVENYSVVTETLAKIYLAQLQYDRAKKAYESLSLRFPEKKSYFADQLKKIDELIHQKKNK